MSGAVHCSRLLVKWCKGVHARLLVKHCLSQMLLQVTYQQVASLQQ